MGADLLAPVATLDTRREGREDLVGDRVAGFGKHRDRALFTPEDKDFVPHPRLGHVSDIDHAGIHTDIADGRAQAAVQEHRIGTTTQTAREAVGITDRDDRDA